MPHYMIYHSHPLDSAQQQAIANGITDLHCKLFSAPSAFVNISFLPAPKTYVARSPSATNFIHAHLRPRGPAFTPQLHSLLHGIKALWHEVVGGTGEGRIDDTRGLHNVFLFEDLSAGMEQGFVLPKAGEEEAWKESNWGDFVARREKGDESVGRLMEELGGK
ncbi:hypothetical protein FB567DRAFT_328829 [Paraphoma chrysanthemicola]|uniref:Tautomerase cis-CaaD-like domain-containing protein n=1 Tax=Paraphoma chrysanthemicola TaxID=798071 RepID=A0A8K0RBR6_9PLEO|nr:hypothetical protein FB567DRAFT_328829 [Paraphoma chrysanthemicola]